MRFTEGGIYHIYNRGNNKRPIFFNRRHYIFFLEKVQKYICASADLLAWALMPNHFHFLIYANAETCRLIKRSPIEINFLTEGIRILLSSYTKAIQKQESITGNLFQQKTKSKCVNEAEFDYSATAFHYIHQNAYQAGLVNRMENWEFSSLPEYLGQNAPGTMNSICNKPLTCELLDLNLETILRDSYAVISHEIAKRIF